MTKHPYSFSIGSVLVGSGVPVLIAGPCMAESLELCLEVGEELATCCEQLGMKYVFKASFDKANRTSGTSYRGPGLEQGLAWFAEVKSTLNVPVITDVHLPEQCAPVAEVADALQIPAFLSRQTDLLLAAAATGKPINVKKGQFMAPWDMENVAEKLRTAGNPQVLLTDRGTFFGYNRLVSDFRCLMQMRAYAPVCYDATHSVQEPGGLGAASGGRRDYAGPLALAAAAVGIDALFIETHPSPDDALSDAGCQIALADMPELLTKLLAVHNAIS